MSQFSSPTAVAERSRGSESFTNLEPLAILESQSIGKEFSLNQPQIHDKRQNDMRQNDVILKTWRGVPTLKEEDTQAVRHGLSSVRDFEIRQAANADRYFLIMLSIMLMLLAIVFAAFIATIS